RWRRSCRRSHAAARRVQQDDEDRLEGRQEADPLDLVASKDRRPRGHPQSHGAVKKGVLSVGVKGGPGTFAATVPLTVTIRFPAADTCGATSFDASDEACVVKDKGKKLVCK